jgi:hypothetical protein
LIVDDVTIQASGEISIEAGSKIQFDYYSSDLIVYGDFTAVGTEASPVVFTSSKAIPAKGDWGAVTFMGGRRVGSNTAYSSMAAPIIFPPEGYRSCESCRARPWHCRT